MRQLTDVVLQAFIRRSTDGVAQPSELLLPVQAIL